ncbi:MAG: sulfate permease [Lachnospiraceae bacterium]|nr:sulfate permease [Lachnospiraceae bacterium]
MEKLKPKLFSVMKNYSKEQLIKDIIAGIVVAIIAIPLSIALAIASGVNPEQGLYTAIIAGFFISFLGGSRVQIGGPTAAFVTIIYGIIQDYSIDGLIVATIMAGIILVIMGICRFGILIKYIPYTITTGFTAGIAVTLAVGQLKDFLGLKMDSVPSEFIEKMKAYSENIHSLSTETMVIGLLALLIHILWPIITDKVPAAIGNIINKFPASLLAIIITTLMVKFLDMDVATIGSSYENVSSALPSFRIPNVNFEMIKNLISPAFTIAILAGIESLLSCVVSDGMIGSKHRSNMELVAQGTGNIFSALFGGIPATGAIARTAANVKNGGRTPIAGIVHSITLFFVLLLFMPLAKLIPMPTLAAILMVVAYNMSSWREFVRLLKSSPKSDILVLVTTFLLTVIFDLIVAIEVGIVMAAILFMKRMADVTVMQGWNYLDDGEDDENDTDNIAYKDVPKGVAVYEIIGPMFFGATDKFLDVSTAEHGKVQVVIIRMRGVPALDVTALHSLEGLVATCHKKNIKILFSHVQEQPLRAMEKAGFYELVGSEHFRKNIDDALAYASELLTKK